MKPHHVGVDLGEWFALVPIVGPLIKEGKAIKAMPRGPARRAAVKDLVLGKVEAITDWLDNALED